MKRSNLLTVDRLRSRIRCARLTVIRVAPYANCSIFIRKAWSEVSKRTISGPIAEHHPGTPGETRVHCCRGHKNRDIVSMDDEVE
ncbi:hypothetical protein K523DRAFT_319910 [Schizophyllum commune Tattone D]|nr:hypothetical protein K523DRAFT_319910 [Schizophyllum commune Tattone D]